MSWINTTVGDLIDVKHGFAFKSEYFSDSGEYVVLTPGNCYNEGGFKSKGEKEKWYVGEIPESYLLNEGDLLLVMTDLVNTAPVLGGSFLIPDNNKYLHNQRLGLVQIKEPSRTNKRFLYYLFNTHQYRGQVRGSASGSTVRHTAPERIKSCKVRIPSEYDDQKRISDTLVTYDDLIENNKRRIELLEESAQQLYKEWFVRFRFPGHEHVKIIDGVPDGWRLGTYGDAFEFLGGFAFKSKTYIDDGRYGVVTIKNVHDSRFVPECPSRVEQIPDKMKGHCKLSTGDILLSLTGNVGRACILFGNNYLLNQRVAKISTKDSVTPEFAYWTFTDRSNQRKIENLAYGVAQLNLSPVKLAAMEFIIPSKTLVEQFSDITSLIFKQIIQLNLANQELAKARDLLLPKLMNGEIAV